MVIRDNGDVVMCCMDAEGNQPVVGNIRDGVREVWFGEAFTRIRREPQELCKRCLCQWVNEE